jgi:hypothetical protein
LLPQLSAHHEEPQFQYKTKSKSLYVEKLHANLITWNRKVFRFTTVLSTTAFQSYMNAGKQQVFSQCSFSISKENITKYNSSKKVKRVKLSLSTTKRHMGSTHV